MTEINNAAGFLSQCYYSVPQWSRSLFAILFSHFVLETFLSQSDLVETFI